MSGSGSESADITLSLPDDVQIADSLTVAGNLTVNGTLTSLDTTNLDIEDNLFQLNAGLTGSPVNDSGMLINRGDQDNGIFMWDESVDKFTLGLTTADGSATGNITLNSLGTLVANLEGNVTGAVTGTVSSLSNHDTGDLAEGSNLYYTQARFDSAFTAKSTSDLSEGSNLYYTDARFDTRLGTKDTDDVSEGTSNLYYTTARFDSAFGGKSTSDLSEGTNLYYTDARVQAVSINNVVEDTTPQLGGNLDLNSSDITGTGDINITGTIQSSGNITGTLATAAQPNITSVGTLTGLNVAGTPTFDGLTVDGTATFNTGTGTTNNFIITGTDAGGNTAPDLVLFRDSASPVDGDNIGMLLFKGNNDAGTSIGYAGIFATINDASSTTEDGKLNFSVATANTESPSGGTTFMTIEGGGDISFYEDTGTTAKLFWDASAERLGIGTTSPSSELHVIGETRVEQTGAASRLVINRYDVNAADSSTIDLLESSSQGASFGTTGVFGYRLELDGNTNNLNIKSGNQSTVNTRLSIERDTGNVGIGTDSPTTNLQISKASTDATFRIDRTGTGASALLFTCANGETSISSTKGGQDLILKTANIEAARIDSSGNLLVGKDSFGLSTDGVQLSPLNSSAFTANDSVPLYLNRRTEDGDLLQFRKDGLSVGSIGTRDTGALEIGSGDVYLQFNGANDWIKPVDGSGSNKSGVDLGTSGAKFDNLRLSGTAYVDTAVGIGGSPSVSLDIGSKTDAIKIPVGTTAQRPASPANGMVRYNTTESEYEIYKSNAWFILDSTGYTYSADFLVIAGGGGGSGTSLAGGGGAGGYRTSAGTSGGGASAESSLTFIGGTTYTITVGAGGSGGATGSNGGDSSISGSGLTTITSIGGGAGSNNGTAGASGGSGGGSGRDAVNTGGAGTAGQGFAGGNGGGSGNSSAASGGGGAGAVGASVSSPWLGGDGGVGVASTITGTSVYRAGGGGGAAYAGLGRNGGTGGNGGGGNGSGNSGTDATAGTANTGGGGGGGFGSSSGGAGGSGVVILRILSTKYSGITTGSPTVTTDGDYKVITFNSSGSYTA